jgi:crossover junction endodeoxyribonuclease RuvC
VIVLGLDPGASATGYGVVELAAPGATRLVECGVVRTVAASPLEQRLSHIFDAVSEIIARHRPDAVAVESVFVAKNPRSALVLGHARGAALLAAAKAAVPVWEYAPAMVKKTVVGVGAATKAQVQAMTARRLRLRTAPSPDDAADGVAVALTHCMRGARSFRRAAALAPGRDPARGGTRASSGSSGRREESTDGESAPVRRGAQAASQPGGRQPGSAVG